MKSVSVCVCVCVVELINGEITPRFHAYWVRRDVLRPALHLLPTLITVTPVLMMVCNVALEMPQQRTQCFKFKWPSTAVQHSSFIDGRVFFCFCCDNVVKIENEAFSPAEDSNDHMLVYEPLCKRSKCKSLIIPKINNAGAHLYNWLYN